MFVGNVGVGPTMKCFVESHDETRASATRTLYSSCSLSDSNITFNSLADLTPLVLVCRQPTDNADRLVAND